MSKGSSNELTAIISPDNLITIRRDNTLNVLRIIKIIILNLILLYV